MDPSPLPSPTDSFRGAKIHNPGFPSPHALQGPTTNIRSIPRSLTNLDREGPLGHDSSAKQRPSTPVGCHSASSETSLNISASSMKDKTQPNWSGHDPENSTQDTSPCPPKQAHLSVSRTLSDPEKATPKIHPPLSAVSDATPQLSPGRQSTVNYTWEDLPERPDEGSEHHLKALLHLSLLSPFVAFILSLYSLVAIMLLAATMPLSLCIRGDPFSARLIHAISPAIRFQLRLIYSEASAEYPPAGSRMLVFVAVLSPLYGMGIAMSSWIAAFFWLYAAILGEPNERGGKEEEGRAAVRAVVRWWERWLLWGAL